VRSHRGRYPLLAEEDLISRVGDGGGAQALALLYDRHSRAAFSLAYRMMGERQASD
jgi:RNA polymerase sigma-70 factor (ECF subfamily)